MTVSTETTPTRRGAANAIDVLPTGAALGAEAVGLDLRDIDDAAFGRLLDAWHTHSVVLVRGQALSDQNLIACYRCGHAPRPGHGPPSRIRSGHRPELLSRIWGYF